MKTWHRILVAVAVVVLGTTAMAQVVPPQIGVFFDTAATMDRTNADSGQIVNAYVVATGGQFLLGGVAFALDVPAGMTLVAATRALDGVEIYADGDLTGGVEFGFYDPQFVDDGHPLVLYNLVLMMDQQPPLTGAEISVVPHPSYTAVQAVQNDGVKFDTEGLSGTIAGPAPVVGIYWDQAATVTSATYNGGVGENYTAYVMVTGQPLLLGGAAFKLNFDPNVILLTVTPEPSVVIGDVFNGIEIGLYDFEFVDPSHPGLLMTLMMTTMNNLVDHAPLCVAAHPTYGQVLVVNNEGVQIPAEGACAYLTVPVGTEDRSWSDVKTLFK